MLIFDSPSKMCIKSGPFLYQKSDNWALNYGVLFMLWYVLMLLNKFVKSTTIRRCSSGIHSYFNYKAKFSPNIM